VDRTAAVVRGHLVFRCIRTARGHGSFTRLQGLAPRRSSSPAPQILAAAWVRCSPGVPASSGSHAARTWDPTLPPVLLPWASPRVVFPSIE
jgi:hypothetical protein